MVITSITDGLSQGSGHCMALIRPIDEENIEFEYESIYVDWSEGKKSKVSELNFIASGITQLNNTIYILGRLGMIARIEDGVFNQEIIQGPDDFGFLTNINAIGDQIIVSGMSRQVYIRNNGKWDRFDHGVLDERMEIDHITGFRSLDGLSLDDIYAVGLDGEIWNYKDNNWREIDSPTNLILEQVKVISSEEVYAVGQSGVILHGYHDTWKVINQTLTDDDFWGLEWFNETVYITSNSNIYKLARNRDLELITPTDSTPQYFSRLRSSTDTLWSFGPEKIYWTCDGFSWREAKILYQSI